MEINSALSSVPLPRWVLMWAVAFALYAGCKGLTYREALTGRVRPGRWRAAGYLLFWPGMDATAFLYGIDRIRPPRPSEWTAAALKTLLGVALIWAAARLAQPISAVLAGWVGMTGLMFVLHFGTFHLLSLGWRTVGVDARPVMQNPLRSISLAEFWGRRWNTAFHQLATRFTFRPLRPAAGRVGATLAAFLASGLIHELVISVPAQGGYGLPTGYFLLQGLGLLGERARAARRGGLGRGWRGRAFTFLVAAGPAFWLFPPVFVRHVILPMLGAIGAL
jgi:alginate O-acetyltransferase complex protein AlgI